MDIPRTPPDPERDAAIQARQNLAGRTGFILGCLAALAALVINLLRARPFTVLSVLVAVLMAALNMPVGIILGLLGERLTRPRDLRK